MIQNWSPARRLISLLIHIVKNYRWRKYGDWLNPTVNLTIPTIPTNDQSIPKLSTPIPSDHTPPHLSPPKKQLKSASFVGIPTSGAKSCTRLATKMMSRMACNNRKNHATSRFPFNIFWGCKKFQNLISWSRILSNTPPRNYRLLKNYWTLWHEIL